MGRGRVLKRSYSGFRAGIRMGLLGLAAAASQNPAIAQNAPVPDTFAARLIGKVITQPEPEDSEEDEIPNPALSSVTDSRDVVQHPAPIFLAPKSFLWFFDDTGSNQFRESRDPFELRRTRALSARLLNTGRPDEFWFGRRADRSVRFATFDTTGKDHYLSFGIKHATRNTLETAGMRFFTTLGLKLGDYDARLDQVRHRPHSARVLVGREWHMGPLSVAVLGGGSYLFHPIGLVQETGRIGRFGGAAMADFWWNWQIASLPTLRFTSGYILADSADRSLSARMRFGFAWNGSPIRFGPEISASAGSRLRFKEQVFQGAWKKGRIGFHISEIETGWMFLGLAGGLDIERGKRAGFYGQVSTYMRY